eukprot:gene13705-29143_t
MLCFTTPLLAAFGQTCISKGEGKLTSEHDVSTSNSIKQSNTGFPLLEMDLTIKTSLSKGVEDKTDSDSSRSSESNESKKSLNHLKDINIIKTIGSGRFGYLKIGYFRSANQYIYLSSFHKSVLSDTCQQHIPSREKAILHSLTHPFITKLVGAFQDSNSLYLMLEACHGGDLSRLIATSNCVQNGDIFASKILSKPLSENQIMFYAACVVSVFKYTHSKNILHRGLHPDTLLIDDQGFLKVVDWGFAKHVDDHTFTLCGHVEYLCPEAILYDSGYGKGVDYWALGVLIYEMLAGHSAFVVRSSKRNNNGGSSGGNSSLINDSDNNHHHENNNNNNESGYDDASTVENIISAEIEFPETFSASACSIISGLCQKNPTVRLGCVKNGRGVRDIMAHPWFAEVDWDKLESRQITPPWIPIFDNDADFKYFGDGYIADDVVSTFEGYNHLEWNSF